MSRYTPPSDPDDRLPDLRQRNPMMWWMAVIMVVAMILGTVGSALILLFSAAGPALPG